MRRNPLADGNPLIVSLIVFGLICLWIVPANFIERRNLAALAEKQRAAFSDGKFEEARALCDQMETILTGR